MKLSLLGHPNAVLIIVIVQIVLIGYLAIYALGTAGPIAAAAIGAPLGATSGVLDGWLICKYLSEKKQRTNL